MASRHFTLDDRQHIYEGICKGLSIRSIAHNLGVSPSTVSRELENIVFLIRMAVSKRMVLHVKEY